MCVGKDPLHGAGADFFARNRGPGTMESPRERNLGFFHDQSLFRMIFPLMVLGSSSRNTTILGYL